MLREVVVSFIVFWEVMLREVVVSFIVFWEVIKTMKENITSQNTMKETTTSLNITSQNTMKETTTSQHNLPKHNERDHNLSGRLC
jgi:hypothetical protein